MPVKVSTDWEESLIALKASKGEWGAVRLWRALQEEATEKSRTDAPSQGWVSKWLREVWPKVTEDERRDRRSFRWPESMGSDGLPWEASSALLDLLRRKSPDGELRRPTNGVARWYWGLYQVARPEKEEFGDPDEYENALNSLEVMASTLAAYETPQGLPDLLKRSVEGWLVCKGWTEEGEQRYKEGVCKGLWIG